MSDREILKIIQAYNTTMLYLLTLYNRQQRTPVTTIVPPSISTTTSTSTTNPTALSSLLQTLLSSHATSIESRNTTDTEENDEMNEQTTEEIVFSFMPYDTSRTTSTSTNTVRSRLTQRQIMDHTEIFVYTDEELNNSTCPISHVDFEPGHILCKIKNCQHTFKYTELMPWLDINTTCPVCRRPIVS